MGKASVTLADPQHTLTQANSTVSYFILTYVILIFTVRECPTKNRPPSYKVRLVQLRKPVDPNQLQEEWTERS